MIGDKYWSTGISLKWDGRDKWAAIADFFDSGFCDDESTEGQLRTRYYVNLDTAIDTLIEDATRLGIDFRVSPGTKSSFLYCYHDDDKEWPLPEGWREILNEQAKRIGWLTHFESEGKEQVPA